MIMRIIHTSDWHLGQHFFGKSRANEHQAFLSWLLEQIQTHHIDAVIIAGDIFDTGSPPSYAREMYNQFIVDLYKINCPLIVLGGNHDSVMMLNESKTLVAQFNTQVIANVLNNIDEQIIPLYNDKQQLNGIVCAAPFIRPRDIIKSQAGQSAEEKQRALQTAISDHYQHLYKKACELREQQHSDVPIILTGHLATVGASLSDSVRDIYIGTLDAFPAQAFPPADYIALGHIHRHQKVAKTEHIRYCGSPIPLSFDEVNYDKYVLLVEFDGATLQHVEPLTVPRFQALHSLKGTLNDIEQQLDTLIPTLNAERPTWLEIKVTAQDFLSDLQQRIQQMIYEQAIEVLLLRRTKDKTPNADTQDAQMTLQELSIQEVFERRLKEEDWQDDCEKARAKRLQNAFKHMVNELQTQQHNPANTPAHPLSHQSIKRTIDQLEASSTPSDTNSDKSPSKRSRKKVSLEDSLT